MFKSKNNSIRTWISKKKKIKESLISVAIRVKICSDTNCIWRHQIELFPQSCSDPRRCDCGARCCECWLIKLATHSAESSWYASYKTYHPEHLCQEKACLLALDIADIAAANAQRLHLYASLKTKKRGTLQKITYDLLDFSEHLGALLLAWELMISRGLGVSAPDDAGVCEGV